MNTDSGAAASLRQMMVGAWMTQALSVVAELGVADVLAKAPATPAELASTLKTTEEGMLRILRALSSVGVFQQNGEGRFEMAALGQLLRSDVADSQRAFARMAGAEFYTAWHGLRQSVELGTPGFDAHYGKEFFAYMGEHPDRWGIYDQAMHAVHGPETEPMLESYDFGAFATVVDVGGGNGRTLAAILKRYPHLHGVLYELPDVADRARATFDEMGLAHRATVSAGDFFKTIPRGADAYLLRHVIHDWNDADAVTILSNCRKSMHPESKLLMVESVISPGNGFSFVKWLDLMMMLVGGRERTADEYGKLLHAAGLRLSAITPTSCEISVLEGVIS